MFSRRDLVRMSVASAFGAAACPWLPRLAAAADQKKTPKGCIVLWMSGGPSQMDTWDLKPGHKNGGPFKETATAVPGLRFSEHLPKLAAGAKELGIIRGMTTKEGEHGRATQLLHTGQLPSEAVAYPALGSLMSKALGDPEHDLPGYVTVSPGGLNMSAGPGFLGPQFAPMAVSGISDNPNARANLTVDYLKPEKPVAAADQDARRQLLADLQSDFEKQHGGAAAKAHAAAYRKAQKLIDTEAKGAFKLDEEKSALRDAYGRSRFGQGCLLARRLVERGVSFVEVTLDGWDTHAQNFDAVKTLSATLDPAFATLVSDLKDRGMLENTLVVWMGEFGRTPLINPTAGRDHFPVAWSAVMAGAGVRGGRAIGKTSADGTKVEEKPVGAADFLATVFTAVGVDPKSENQTTDGRPIQLAKGGAVVEELVK
ncbi:secreted protein containing duf1501 : Uncharacterized protein OS=Planctomyces maris DSM 8797 GN=PM8797T_09209 PE=4 SV=1: DUF1501 [Gemmata massiliana]|uniref:DUF1501 domain-containing protein n=1 Tax=Gemmata massiliana TaxID=1210884 RepID=A0A6P2D9I7_9BACT|nr:DUF1501 domain-containing protein [Gemmata massiliana]VTR96162.1 secreted protein containing duf1501 : Uncharacterized protein OS=Planctomyces maris DSM 8797 GN=PM8797T_09209 PE=4 SV=1: DUF1501 [Gemmata massiliana]